MLGRKFRHCFLMYFSRLGIKRALFLAVCFFTAIYLFLAGRRPDLESFINVSFNNESFSVSVPTKTTRPRCPPPSIGLWNPDILRFYQLSPQINCLKEFNPGNYSGVLAFRLKNGNELEQLVNWSLSCCYRQITHTNRDQYWLSPSCNLISNKTMKIPPNVDFIAVECTTSDPVDGTLSIVYRDAFPLVHPRPPSNKTSHDKHLNILIIGLDGVSRLNFLRHMPHSSSYLLQNMEAIDLLGYSVTGRGTCNNLVPLWTGMSKAELRLNCGGNLQSDRCPFIWTEFSKLGYLTSFAEDQESLNWFWDVAFTKPPTDYYLRPYYLYADKFTQHYKPIHHCLGTRLALRRQLRYAEDIRKVAEAAGQPYFQFVWNSRHGHDVINQAGVGDMPLFRYLSMLHVNGSLNQTVIFVLGDHGNKLDDYYNTENGFLEYRLPLAFIVLPSWFRLRYPEMYRNLWNNRNKMTTSYDIRKTLLHLIALDNWKDTRRSKGISLFEEVPGNRKCLEAGIPLKWCNLCYPRTTLKQDDPLISYAAKFLLAEVNKRVKDFGDKCEKQTLDEVRSTETTKWDHRDVTQELCNVHGKFDLGVDDKDFLQHTVNYSCEPEDTVDIVRVEVKTKPKGATYVAEVMLAWKKGDREAGKKPYKGVLTDEPYRQDTYSSMGSCVDGEHKPYCICKYRNVTGTKYSIW